MNIYKVFTFFLLTILTAIFYFVIKVDFYANVPRYKDLSSPSSTIDIKDFTHNASSNDVKSVFSYHEYVKNRNRINISVLLADLKELDSLYPESKLQNKKLILNAMTDSLSEIEQSIFSSYQPDQLILLLQWVEQFKYYPLIDNENDVLYASIRDFWMNKMADSLVAYSQNSPSIKYDFKFRFIKAKFSESGFDFGPKVTSFEKVLYNVIDSNWSHLLDASWSQATAFQKVLFLLIASSFVYAYFLLFKNVINYFKSR